MKTPFALSVILSAGFLASCSGSPEVKSPDGSISVNLLRNDSTLQYTVDVDGERLIDPSMLGFVAEGLTPSVNAKVLLSTSEADEEWTQPWGENKHNRNHYKEVAMTLTDPDLEMTIRVRAFNDGVALRYEWNVQGRDTVTVMEELTEFNFAENARSWSIPADFDSYEKDYRMLPLNEVENANTPFTFVTDRSQIYGSVHEAALYDYPEMTLLQKEKGSCGFRANLAPLPNGIKAVTPSKFVTPWRTIQIGRKATDLINSAMILNLNEPSKIADTSWIKPQKYVGVWWGMHLGTQTWVMGPRHGATTANAIKYINFAADNNLQGVLFEGWNEGWENWGGSQHFNYLKAYPDFDIDSISRYATKKGIELWAHNETGGNVPEYESQLDSIFAYYQSLGIHTVKTGYAGSYTNGYYHHSQYGVRHYQKVVETAAKYGLMIDAHEPIKETGIRRTWPNMMTREGAKGMEWNAWSEGNSADYLCILPFARLLAGPMDYTPGVFDLDYVRARSDLKRQDWNGPLDNCKIHTTLARQIANWVIIYSPLQMGADLIENYDNQPGFQFFRDFNADCDRSEALQGEIGEYIAVVRRAGENFYLGAGTNSKDRTLNVPLDFLENGVTYEAVIYGDNLESGNVHDLTIDRKDVTSADELEIRMLPSGGQAISFFPKK